MTTITELKSLLLEQSAAIEHFAGRLNAADDAIVKLQRPGAVFAGTGGDLSAPEVKAFADWMRTGRGEVKGMTVGDDPSGGYLVPSPLHDLISKSLKELSPMRGLARVVNMGEGSSTKFVHSGGGTAASWAGENSDRTDTAAPALAQTEIPLCELYALPVVSQKLIDDAGFDIGTWLAQELAETFAEVEGEAFIVGDGVAKPRGVFTYPTATTADSARAWGTVQHVVTGADGDFHTTQFDALVNLTAALKPGYRTRASFLTNTAVVTKLRLMKEATTNRPLWEPSLQLGQPDRLMGYPVFVDDRVPALATGSLSLAFGDFNAAYTVIERAPIQMLRDPYTEKGRVKFYTTFRVGGGLVNSDAVKFLKFSA